MATRRKNESWGQNALDFLQNNWAVLLGIIFAYPIIVNYFRKSEAKDKISEAQTRKTELEAVNSNPVTQATGLFAITSDTAIHDAARRIIEYLNVDWSWNNWNPFSFLSRQTDLAYKAVVSVYRNGKVPTALIECYDLLSNGRNLHNDMLEYLPNNVYEKIKW